MFACQTAAALNCRAELGATKINKCQNVAESILIHSHNVEQSMFMQALKRRCSALLI